LGDTDWALDDTLRIRVVTLAVITKSRIDPVMSVLDANGSCGTQGSTVVTFNTTAGNFVSHNTSKLGARGSVKNIAPLYGFKALSL